MGGVGSTGVPRSPRTGTASRGVTPETTDVGVEETRGPDRPARGVAATWHRGPDAGATSIMTPRTARKRPATPQNDRPYGEEELHELQRNTFRYFWEETNPGNGLIPDNTAADDFPASIAGVGLALATYPVAVERSFVTRARAAERVLATLRFFWNAPQGATAEMTGHRGFFYHFLDITTGRRAWECEL